MTAHCSKKRTLKKFCGELKLSYTLRSNRETRSGTFLETASLRFANPRKNKSFIRKESITSLPLILGQAGDVFTQDDCHEIKAIQSL